MSIKYIENINIQIEKKKNYPFAFSVYFFKA